MHTLCGLKVKGKNEIIESQGKYMPQYLIAGDNNGLNVGATTTYKHTDL